MLSVLFDDFRIHRMDRIQISSSRLNMSPSRISLNLRSRNLGKKNCEYRIPLGVQIPPSRTKKWLIPKSRNKKRPISASCKPRQGSHNTSSFFNWTTTYLNVVVNLDLLWQKMSISSSILYLLQFFETIKLTFSLHSQHKELVRMTYPTEIGVITWLLFCGRGECLATRMNWGDFR